MQENINAAVELLDTDHDGLIAVREIRQLLTKCGDLLESDDVDEIIRMLEAAGVETMSKAQFATYILAH